MRPLSVADWIGNVPATACQLETGWLRVTDSESQLPRPQRGVDLSEGKRTLTWIIGGRRFLSVHERRGRATNAS